MSQEHADNAAVDAAINRVLAAELESRVAVERCAEEAAEIVAAAQAQADRIEQRTEARVLRAHRIADRRLESVLRGLAAENPDDDEAVELPAAERIDQAVALLVDEMVGPPG